MQKSLRAAVYSVAMLGLTITAHADISGSAWLVQDGSGNCAQNAVISCIPASAADARFTVKDTALSTGFTSVGTDGSLGAFINSVGSANLTTTAIGSYTLNNHVDYLNGSGVTAATQLNQASGNFNNCNANGNKSCGTIFEFTGTAFFTQGETFSVTSDDGFTLYVGTNGSQYTSPAAFAGPQSVSTNSVAYTGSTGTFAFTFVYSECCSLPADFSTNLSTGGNVPEPGSLVLFGTLLVGLGLGTRRRTKV